MIINRIYETQNLLSLLHVSFLVGLRTYQQLCLCPDRSQRPRGLKCGSAAARLLGYRIRNTQGAWMSVCCEVVCCQVEFFASGWSLVQRSPTDCVVPDSDRNVSIMRRPWPTRGCCTTHTQKTCAAEIFVVDAT